MKLKRYALLLSVTSVTTGRSGDVMISAHYFYAVANFWRFSLEHTRSYADLTTDPAFIPVLYVVKLPYELNLLPA